MSFKKLSRTVSLSAFVFCGLASNVYAKDFGILGDTFEVLEPSLVEHFEGKLNKLKDEGRLDEIKDEMIAKSKQRIMEPDAVAGLQPATEYRSYHWDPTVVAPQDYKDHDGNIVAAKGTEKNPLDYVQMRQNMLFVDGRRLAEVEWALSEREKSGGLSKIILTAGKPFELMKEYKVRFYYDQRGLISNRFGFEKTPVRISQDKRLLLVEEIVVR